jgi:hypothetical protein
MCLSLVPDVSLWKRSLPCIGHREKKERDLTDTRYNASRWIITALETVPEIEEKESPRPVLSTVSTALKTLGTGNKEP